MKAWKTRPGIVLIQIHGTSLLAADKAARKHCAYLREVNEIGAFIWKQLDSGNDAEKLISIIRQEYEIPADYDLKDDVDAFLQSLYDNNYLIREAVNDEV